MGLPRLPSEPALPTCLGSLALNEAPGITAALQQTPRPKESESWFWREAAHDAERRWLTCRNSEELGVRLHADLKRELTNAQQEAAEATSVAKSLREELAEGGARYADLLHLASQVDNEIATRREAQDRATTAEGNELRTAQRCEAAEAHIALLVPRIAELESLLGSAQKECTQKREAELALQRRLDEIVPEHARQGLDLHTASQNAEVLNGCLRSSETQVQTLQEELKILGETHSELQRAFAEEQRLRSLADEHLKVALEEGQSLRSELKDQGQHAAFLQSEVNTLQENLRRVEDSLQFSEAEHRRWKERAATAVKELQEGEAKAVSTFFCKFPASSALVMVFRRLIDLRWPDQMLEDALLHRMNLHRPTHISRHELEYFLVEHLGLMQADASIVGQVLFAVLDLERQGVLETQQLHERLLQPPAMRAIWRANLEEIWPERHGAVHEHGARSPRQRSPGRASSPTAKRGSSNLKTPSAPYTPRVETPASTGSVPTGRASSHSRTPPPPRGAATAKSSLPPVSDRSKTPSQPSRPKAPRPNSSEATAIPNRAHPPDSARNPRAGKVTSTAGQNRCQSALA